MPKGDPFLVHCSLFDIVRSHRDKIKKLITIFPNPCNLLPNVCRQIVKWLFVTAVVLTWHCFCFLQRSFADSIRTQNWGEFTILIRNASELSIGIHPTFFANYPAQIPKRKKTGFFPANFQPTCFGKLNPDQIQRLALKGCWR